MIHSVGRWASVSAVAMRKGLNSEGSQLCTWGEGLRCKLRTNTGGGGATAHFMFAYGNTLKLMLNCFVFSTRTF